MQLTYKLHLYSFLAQFGFLKKSYVAKIMLVAFLGTHVPLLALLASFIISNSFSLDMTIRVLVISLFATLVGTAATLYALHHLLSPVILTSSALQDYLNTKKLPKLPTKFVDEAGTLMSDTVQTLCKLDELIHYISNYDDLTGLPTRELFCDRLYDKLLKPQEFQGLIAVLLFGIDDFTGLSNVLDYETINLLLRLISQRLIACAGQTDLIARLNSDEFAIAKTDVPSFENVIKLSQLILITMAKPFSVEGKSIHITVSIGISISINESGDRSKVEQLLQQSRMALYEAKRKGRSQSQFYSPEINAHLQEKLTLENELHGALERNEMLVYYQPLVDLHSRQIIAVEALIRWQHPIFGLIPPNKFIPIAEANGLIGAIGEWVLRTACDQNYAWQIAGFPKIRMSVNLSTRQFEQPNLVEIVSQILEESKLEASYLELEVTESLLMSNIDNSFSTLKQLREIGISLALDDFGTGYSSLNYLKQFPVNMLKIDRSFVQDVMTNPDSAAVTDAIIALAKSLKLSITAEGIETKEQLDYLQIRGCDEGQGFYFSRPVPASKITQMFEKKTFTSDWLPTLLSAKTRSS